jgi:hypothetical protein
MVEDWIDALVAVTGKVEIKGKRFKTFPMFKNEGYPESLTTFPSAISYVPNVKPHYSAGGPCYLMAYGTTEFHVAGNLNKSNYPMMMQLFGKIMTVFAADTTLGGKVAYVLLLEEPGIQAVSLTYGAEAEHHGLVVPWVVKEMVSVVVT